LKEEKKPTRVKGSGGEVQEVEITRSNPGEGESTLRHRNPSHLVFKKKFPRKKGHGKQRTFPE